MGRIWNDTRCAGCDCPLNGFNLCVDAAAWSDEDVEEVYKESMVRVERIGGEGELFIDFKAVVEGVGCDVGVYKDSEVAVENLRNESEDEGTEEVHDDCVRGKELILRVNFMELNWYGDARFCRHVHI